MSWLTNNFIANMYGPRFLAFYLIFCFVIFYIVHRKTKQINRDYKAPSLLPGNVDPYEVACLVKGQIGLLSVIVVELIDKGYLQQNPDHTHQLIQNPEYPNPELNPVEKAVWQCFFIPAKIDTAEAAVTPLYKSCIASLKKKGLVAHKEQRKKIALVTATGGLCSLGLGIYKFLIALSRGYRNVGFLLLMMIIVFCIYKIMLWKDVLPSYDKKHYFKTPAGNTFLKKLNQTLASNKAKISSGELTAENGASYLLSVALFGVAVLPYTTELSALKTLYSPHSGNSSNSSHDDDSGCSSGCSSSSCSSGCSSSSCSCGCGGCGSND